MNIRNTQFVLRNYFFVYWMQYYGFIFIYISKRFTG